MMLLPSYDSQFITLFQYENGYVRRHVTVDVKAVDYGDLEMIAVEKAMLGMRIDILPALAANDPTRAIIYPDINGNRNPDLRINGILWEVEGSHNSKNINNLKHAIDRGSKQAECVIINLSDELTDDIMLRVIKGRFKDHINLKVVEFFRYKGKYTPFCK